MSDDEAKVLGLRAVACAGPWWRTHGALLRSGIKGKRTAVRMGVRSVLMTVTGEDGWPLGQDWLDAAWPDLRDGATMGAALALWQAQPGHVFRVPCPVLTNAAAYGLTDPRTIRALVDAMEAAPPR